MTKRFVLVLALVFVAIGMLPAGMSAQIMFIDEFDTNPTLSPTQLPNTWYTDRYAPAAFEMAVFDGGNRLKHSISASDNAVNRPASYVSSFYNTQGRKFDLNNPIGTSITADLYVPAEWETSHRRADIWATMGDDANAITEYPIIGFANTTGTNPTWRIWTNDAWMNISDPPGFVYGAWYTLKTELTATEIRYFINGTQVFASPRGANTKFLDIIIQAYNFGDPALPLEQQDMGSYDVYWDNIGATSFIKNITQSTYHPTLQAAVDAAAPADVIELAAGTWPLPVNTDITKGVTIQGLGKASTVLQVSGTGYRLSVGASGVTVKDLAIQKTDKTGTQDIIWVNGDNFTLKNTEISGQFVIGDGEVSRAMVVSGGHTGLLFEGNTFHSLRQPVYLTGLTTGLAKNNHTYGTKGWVMEGGDLTFTGNTWGTGAGTNVYDIAILSLANNFPGSYPDIVAMSNANNEAVIEDQRVSPAVLSVAYVDAAAAFAGDLGGKYHPYTTITPAIARVVTGGKIYVAAGTYNESVAITKRLTLDGAGSGTDPAVEHCHHRTGNGRGLTTVAGASATIRLVDQRSPCDWFLRSGVMAAAS